MIEAGGVGEDVARRPLQHVTGRPALLRRVLHEQRREPLTELAVPRTSRREAPVPLHQELRRHAREVQHLVRRHRQIASRRVLSVCAPAVHVPSLIPHPRSVVLWCTVIDAASGPLRS